MTLGLFYVDDANIGFLFFVVWPTAQVINFWILPNRYRVLYDNTISLGYDVYTSAVINEPIPLEKEQTMYTADYQQHDVDLKASNQLLQS